MKFLVDAHLPRGLCALLAAAGHDAVHTKDLADQNRTKDSAINELSLREKRIVVTKDTDFYHSHLLQGRPWKLILVRTGNIRARELRALFSRHLAAIVSLLESNTLIELSREGVRLDPFASRRDTL